MYIFYTFYLFGLALLVELYKESYRRNALKAPLGKIQKELERGHKIELNLLLEGIYFYWISSSFLGSTET